MMTCPDTAGGTWQLKESFDQNGIHIDTCNVSNGRNSAIYLFSVRVSGESRAAWLRLRSGGRSEGLPAMARRASR